MRASLPPPAAASVTAGTAGSDQRPDSRASSRCLAAAPGLRTLIDALPPLRLPAGVTVQHAGVPVDCLPFIESGRVDALLHPPDAPGAQIIPVSFGSGELALLSQLFCLRPSLVELVTGEPSVLRRVPIGQVEGCLQADPGLLVLLVRFLAERLREVQTRELGWLHRGVHGRVGATISRLAQATPRQADGRLLLVTTHDALAARCGVSRPKLSLELKHLERAGVLRLGRGSLEVIDPAPLDPAA